MFVVHYNKYTGKISAWGSGDSEQSHFPDHLIVRFDEEFPIDARTQKFDLETFALIPRTADDLNDERLINLRDIVQIELDRTAEYMLVDADVTPEQLESWKTYRRTLRDLLKISPAPTALEFIAEWPLDPDGRDAIGGFR